jgi:S1-C subfamily serine protease
MKTILSVAVLALALVATGTAKADEAPQSIYKRCVTSVAFVVGAEIEGDKRMTGTAFVVDAEQRLLVTCHHVARDATTVKLLFPTRDSKGRVVAERSVNLANAVWIEARVLAVDEKRDLVLLQAESLPATALTLPLAAEEPEPGEELDLIGNPGVSQALFGYAGGRVRQNYQRTWTAAGEGGWLKKLDSRVIESYVQGNGGDSGAPVFNQRGEIAGMHQGRYAPAGTPVSTMAYAISVEELRRFVAKETPKPVLPTDPFENLLKPKDSTDDLFLPRKFDPLRPSLPPLWEPPAQPRFPSPFVPATKK